MYASFLASAEHSHPLKPLGIMLDFGFRHNPGCDWDEFLTPVIANGEVYFATPTGVIFFGLPH
jgi:hypothetical protein